MNCSFYSPEPGRHRQDRMFLIDRCQRYSVSQADHALLYRALQKHARPTGSPGKHLEMLAHQSQATLCSETESPLVFQSSTAIQTLGLYIMPTRSLLCIHLHNYDSQT